MTKIKPLGSRVVIKRSEVQKSKGGILLPETSKEKPKEGEVVAVGPGKTLENGTTEKMNLKVGDKVLFGSYAGTEVKIDDQEFLVMSEDEIFGIIA